MDCFDEQKEFLIPWRLLHLLPVGWGWIAYPLWILLLSTTRDDLGS